MNRKGLLAFAFGLLLSFFIVFLVYAGKDTVPLITVGRNYIAGINSPCNSSCSQLRLSQIQLSRQLNKAKMEYGKLNCEINKLKHKELVTSSGGWCKADSAPSSKQHLTDRPFAQALAQFFAKKRVGSFGDGPGLYKKYFDSTGLLSVYDAFDGAPYCEEVTNGAVKFLDLTVPQYGLPVYDWAMSLEVAEHIPALYESVYLDNLVRHAKEGILLSWAVPGQGGHSHINLKAFKDVKSIMERVGFQWDEDTSKEMQTKATLPWLKSNVNVFRRILKTDLSDIA